MSTHLRLFIFCNTDDCILYVGGISWKISKRLKNNSLITYL